jgi:hypothetical protein
MGHLNSRVEKLENGNGEPCDECGGDPRPGDTYEVTWSAGDHDENEWCGTCGRQTVVVITWGDEPDTRPWWRR